MYGMLYRQHSKVHNEYWLSWLLEILLPALLGRISSRCFTITSTIELLMTLQLHSADEEGTCQMCPSRTTVASTKRQRSSRLFQDTKLKDCDWRSKARLIFMHNKCQWWAEHPFSDYVTKLLQHSYWTGWETPELSPIDLEISQIKKLFFLTTFQ